LLDANFVFDFSEVKRGRKRDLVVASNRFYRSATKLFSEEIMNWTSAQVAALLLSVSSITAQADSNDLIFKAMVDVKGHFYICSTEYAISVANSDLYKLGGPLSDDEVKAEKCLKTLEAEIDRTHTDFFKSNGQGPKAEIVRRWRVRMHDFTHQVRSMRDSHESEIIRDAVFALCNRTEAELNSFDE
jgi:hypothetical protein